MFTPTNVILGLKLAVSAVTILLFASIIAIIMGRRTLHGRINWIFFTLTLVAVIGFEVIIRFINPNLTEEFSPNQRQALQIHLCFSIPSAILLPFMLFTGQKHSKIHVPLAFVFLVCWIGTFVTGIFYLPHTSGG